jgi:hypothetical protein
MTIKALTELSAYILTQYYKNNTQPMLDHCHKDVLWLGPAQHQMIHTKDKLVQLYAKEDNTLHFAVQDLVVTPFPISNNAIEILMTFIVDTFWLDGSTNRVYQRITLSWENKKDEPFIKFIHISNAIDYDAKDTIYPIHYLEKHSHMTLYTEESEPVLFQGPGKSNLYLRPEQILYMESNETKTNIFTTYQMFTCTEKLSSIANRLQNTFIHCHSSYLVNPKYIQSIQRFHITLTNDKQIPVPEKKYTKIKSLIQTINEKENLNK